jgi:hypothetical protein
MVSETSDVLSVSKRLVNREDIFTPSQNLEVDHDHFVPLFLNYSLIIIIIIIIIIPFDSI